MVSLKKIQGHVLKSQSCILVSFIMSTIIVSFLEKNIISSISTVCVLPYSSCTKCKNIINALFYSFRFTYNHIVKVLLIHLWWHEKKIYQWQFHFLGVFKWHWWHVSIDKWGSRVFVQLLKAYGLTEHSCVVFADTGSCGNTTESTQCVLWDLATSFNVLLSTRRCVWWFMICSCPHVPICVKFRLGVCVVFYVYTLMIMPPLDPFLCPNRLVHLSSGPQRVLLLWTDAGWRSGETKTPARG